MKRILGLILVVAMAGAFAVASQARTGASASRERALHVTKECGQYSGEPGGYCTILTSNLPAIADQSKVFYFEAAAGGQLDSDLALYASPGNVALGHVTLSLTTRTGVITFRGGTGNFRGFRARADVTSFGERLALGRDVPLRRTRQLTAQAGHSAKGTAIDPFPSPAGARRRPRRTGG